MIFWLAWLVLWIGLITGMVLGVTSPWWLVLFVPLQVFFLAEPLALYLDYRDRCRWAREADAHEAALERKLADYERPDRR